jgi:hypothetical protein
MKDFGFRRRDSCNNHRDLQADHQQKIRTNMEAKREILPRENGIYATQTTEGFTQQTTIREIPILLSCI